MKDYTYSEIGMLAGAALGGSLSVIGFTISDNSLFFTIAAFGIAAGLLLGRILDRKQAGKGEKENHI